MLPAGLIGPNTRDQAAAIVKNLTEQIRSEEWDTANDLSNQLEAVILNDANVNIDNVLYSEDPLQPLYKPLISYLTSSQTRKQFGVGNTPFNFISNDAGNALNDDEQQSVLHLLPNLIANYRVMIYTGNMDLNCNIAGVDGTYYWYLICEKENFNSDLHPQRTWKQCNGRTIWSGTKPSAFNGASELN